MKGGRSTVRVLVYFQLQPLMAMVDRFTNPATDKKINLSTTKLWRKD